MMAAFPLAHIGFAVADEPTRKAWDAFLREVFAAETVYEVLTTPESEALAVDRHQTLLAIGDTILIAATPAGRGLTPDSPVGTMLRHHMVPGKWIGIALSVADLDSARAWVRARGFEPKSYPKLEQRYFILDRDAALGVRLEFLKGDLKDDPRLKPRWDPGWWRDSHPLGIEGLQCIGVSTPSLDKARGVFAGTFGWLEISTRAQSQDDADCAAFVVGDTVIEAMQPRDAESALAHHSRDIKGIYCLTFQVRSAAAAADYLRGRGLKLVGDSASRFAIDPDQAFGRLLYFTDVPLDGRPAFRSLIAQPAVLPDKQD